MITNNYPPQTLPINQRENQEKASLIPIRLHYDTKAKETTRKENQYTICMLMQKILRKEIANPNKHHIKQLDTKIKWELFLECKGGTTLKNQSM